MLALLTGASGFVGRSVIEASHRYGCNIRPVFRTKAGVKRYGAAAVFVPTLDGCTDWGDAVVGVDVVIHCAAQVNPSADASNRYLHEFRGVNVEGTLALARQAASRGVKRFVFISSIKVNGESTEDGHAYKADDPPAPEDSYSVSKAEAEAGLRKLAMESGMELTIIRPPLIYGPGGKGNFFKLVRMINSGIPLPFGAISHNLRSLVAIDNLVDLIFTCLSHPNAANETFLVSDGHDLSTVDLLYKMGKALRTTVRLVPVPVICLNVAAKILKREKFARRLLGSLRLDIAKTCSLLDWKPVVSVDDGLKKAVE